MKIALHLFGHLRTYRKCIPSLNKKLIGQNSCDVFMHTWNQVERKTLSWYQSKLSPIDITADDVRVLKEQLPIKKLLISEQVIPSELQDDPLIGYKKMHESIRLSSDLRLNSEYARDKYDLVIYCRPDILIRHPFPLDVITQFASKSFYENTVFQASYAYSAEGIWVADDYGGRDCLFMGSPNIMAHFSSIGLDERIYIKDKSQHRTGEVFFDNFLYINQIRHELIKYEAPKKWKILR